MWANQPRSSHGMDQPRRQAPKGQHNNMSCCCSLSLDFDTVDMLNKISKHVCCKAPSSSACPSCMRQDSQSRSQSFFYVRAACPHVALFFSCCRALVSPDVLTDLPFVKRRSTPKSVSLSFVVARTWDLQEAFVSQTTSWTLSVAWLCLATTTS